jgi:hypothetical protein
MAIWIEGASRPDGINNAPPPVAYVPMLVLEPIFNCLEALKGDLAGKHSIRINDQWRLVFRWTDDGPEDVEIIDYHRG